MLSPELGWTESAQQGVWDTGHESMTRNMVLAISQERCSSGEPSPSLAAVRLACSSCAVVWGSSLSGHMGPWDGEARETMLGCRRRTGWRSGLAPRLPGTADGHVYAYVHM